MTVLLGLSDAHLVLLVVQLCSIGDISQLPGLLYHFRHPPSPDVLLRIILTFLPESLEPSRYTSVIKRLTLDPSTVPTELDIDTSAIAELSCSEARKQVRKLRLLPLQYPGCPNDVLDTPLTQFLIHRAYRIDNECGVQTFIVDLIRPFVETSDFLRNWLISTILPLVRFNYEYHPDRESALSLELLESLDCKSAVNTLLSNAERRENGGNVDRDLRGLIGPWIYGHGKLKGHNVNGNAQLAPKTKPQASQDDFEYMGWQDVNEWLLSTGIRDFALAVETVIRWAGPGDVDLGGYDDPKSTISEDIGGELISSYGQAAIAAIYTISECNKDTLEGAFCILSRIAGLLEIEGHSALQVQSDEILPPPLPPSHIIPSNICRRNFLHNALLQPSNPLTYPTRESIAFLDAILVSIRMLNGFGHSMTPRHAAETCLLGDEESQLFELREVLGILKRDSKQSRDWDQARKQLLWLKGWGSEQTSMPCSAACDSHAGLFWRIPLALFEKEILNAMLMAKQCALSLSVYTSLSSPLSRDDVEAAVAETIFVSYDNASNGNKTRGGMKRATEILDSFAPHFPHSVAFQQIRSLISATHSLSFYSLTLQHGVPFQPVSIRMHQDPLSLIERVLEQNAKAYTELDNILKIGRDLIAAGLPHGIQDDDLPDTDLSALSQEQIQLISAHRITSLAISSALSANDFDTAYSYTTTRLAHDTKLLGSMDTSPVVEDNISWRAAYNAGRHRSTAPEAENSSLQSRISRLSQQMELLSLALILSPSPDNLPEILAVWRRCDEEMNILQTQEQEEAEDWDTHGDTTSMSSVPGGFGPSDAELDAIDTQRERAKRLRASHRSRRDYEEAPMGLFDVARGAARAISKNAFPLTTAAPSSRPGSVTSSRPRQSIDISSGSEMAAAGFYDGSETPSEAGEGSGRVRKRDVVSNMVTGGLVSGLGWVLGAQPVNQNTK
ncbi:hypothetical protein CIHG_09269 [Coccidioides immitis H538.4]|uniref:Sec39 domain-containing protein n=2 Tax=Coccidioides immitis TaxID=5501 RepID=A0A0J8S2W6_COCIT|nr:hypothetical protein CIRG_07803 [Coccidioides immitis RMSCC 2394]KMU91517.1 hypothetical protein CIHG_09269 [Coccidioides immitis H538.4]TPX19835.1 hypothetical protein DIZ76_017627 [Coccidioides immitis]